jgi:hypothetical protein
LLMRDGTLVVEALGCVGKRLPFPMRGVDFDNDSVFMNDLVVGWCREAGLVVTRARAYRKNDQAWVEQKNGAIVRRLVGYGRLEGLAAAQTLGELYAAARLHGNAFVPSFKLRSKQRVGGRVVKRFDPPMTPLERAHRYRAISPVQKARAAHALRIARSLATVHPDSRRSGGARRARGSPRTAAAAERCGARSDRPWEALEAGRGPAFPPTPVCAQEADPAAAWHLRHGAR